ncbi:translation elongation factor Ts [Mesomycoplasma neurolyticum]|uniref:Elongation factor Ts n=1 Tax=Mesomycoplasma neurolyticum TaxID=2120 RepID=A0A449A4N2_9BACT|nr:translation elongation factor Ts [Mesomycoplasma neurolyticum]VEU59197.1 Elongation factor Ts [Mesomycoplasma neurolyticum]
MEKVNTMSLIKELRERTDAPFIECKKALESSGWNIDKAIDWLQNNGKVKAAKKAGRIAAEGLVSIAKNEKSVVILEINSETDFVAKNAQFVNLVTKISNILLENDFTTNDEALKLKNEEGVTVEELTTIATATIGEKIVFRRANKFNYNPMTQVAGTYVHTNGRIASIVILNGKDEEVAKNISMHISAMNPEYTFVTDYPKDEYEKLKQEFTNELNKSEKDSKKPENIKSMMIQGKIEKELSKFVLELQEFVVDSSFKVKKYLESKNSSIVSVVRYEVGEGIEKKENNFVAEVNAQLAEATKK